jgi:Arc/MetJ-type ribon-helix-helix transcriptional regulator
MEESEEIKLPSDYIDKIDKIIDTGRSIYPSREDFIKSAVEIRLSELGGVSGNRVVK